MAGINSIDFIRDVSSLVPIKQTDTGIKLQDDKGNISVQHNWQIRKQDICFQVARFFEAEDG